MHESSLEVSSSSSPPSSALISSIPVIRLRTPQSSSSASTSSPQVCLAPPPLSQLQVDEFVTNGVLVVDNILTPAEVQRAKDGFQQSLKDRGVNSLDTDDVHSVTAFAALSSTNGSGGVLDIFYDHWKLEVATHPKLFAATQQLWKEGYNLGGPPKESISTNDRFKWHPYGADIDFSKGYVYIDRVGYRIPTERAQALGECICTNSSSTKPTTVESKKKKKLRSIQRPLTPHLDCCPDSMYEDTAKWRPIQCFVSLTDNLEANTGGFEAVRDGFHRTFDEWARSRRPTSIIVTRKSDTSSNNNVTRIEELHKAACLGEYTHIRPKEDADVMQRVVHIPVHAGSAVFWDNRVPHANSYRNDSNVTRAVVYCSFLPDIELNRRYVQNQLKTWMSGRPIRDQWNHIDEMDVGENQSLQSTTAGPTREKQQQQQLKQQYAFTELGMRLMGIQPW